MIASNFFIKKSLCLALELVTSAHSRREFFVLYEKLLLFDINAFFGKFDFLSFLILYITVSCLYKTNMNYLLFLVPGGKNLKCQKVSILKGFFFISYKNHFKLANWLHTRTAPFSTIQLNSNILCRVFIYSNTISKIILAIFILYLYLIDNFPIFNPDVTNVLLNF